MDTNGLNFQGTQKFGFWTVQNGPLARLSQASAPREISSDSS